MLRAIVKLELWGSGMLRKFLLSGAAFAALMTGAYAADLPSRSAPPVYIPPPPVFTWTGFYVGGQIGYGWGRETDTVFSNATGAMVSTIGTLDPSGVVGGAHLGYNMQVGMFVFGLEGDINGASYKGSTFGQFVPAGAPFGVIAVFPGAPAIIGTAATAIPIQGSLRGRAGLAFDRALVYATGGLALADIHDTFTYGAAPTTDNFWNFRAGWTVGGGVEYAVDNNWSLRAEYRYSDFGRYSDPLSAIPDYVSKHPTENLVQAGFSYKFGAPPPPPPVIAKY